MLQLLERTALFINIQLRRLLVEWLAFVLDEAVSGV